MSRNIYTYPVIGLGYLPDPDSVQDHGSDIESAISAFYDDINLTCIHLALNAPDDIPAREDIRKAIESGSGMVYGYGGWLHVIGVE